MSDCCGTENTSLDLLVIDAGSAGFSAAITAAEADAKVVVIGESSIGETCVNVGDVPFKNLIRTTESLHKSIIANRLTEI